MSKDEVVKQEGSVQDTNGEWHGKDTPLNRDYSIFGHVFFFRIGLSLHLFNVRNLLCSFFFLSTLLTGCLERKLMFCVGIVHTNLCNCIG